MHETFGMYVDGEEELDQDAVGNGSYNGLVGLSLTYALPIVGRCCLLLFFVVVCCCFLLPLLLLLYEYSVFRCFGQDLPPCGAHCVNNCDLVYFDNVRCFFSLLT